MLTQEDQNLVEQARDIITLRQRQDWHHIGCAMRTRSGKIFTAVHLEAYVGRVAVCAEALTVGMGAAIGDTDIDTIVAVNRAGNVVAPCGMCRELIADYAPQARVIMSYHHEQEVTLTSMTIAELLPHKYQRS